MRSTPRFEFGKNWQSFISSLTEERVREAERSLADMLRTGSLAGVSFLDIGSGSGLFSLAARRLGARVVSFDYDPVSVACTLELKSRYFPGDLHWDVAEGSVLDREFLGSLGVFDIVYSWGVLHHTGELWKAMGNVQIPVRAGGVLFIAIYNDQGAASDLWAMTKRLYCSSVAGRVLVSAVMLPYFALRGVAAGLITAGSPFRHFTEYRTKRGMSVHHDWVDWLGGYPFEVARPEQVLRFYGDAGFVLTNMIATRGSGCNQYVFRRSLAERQARPASPPA